MKTLIERLILIIAAALVISCGGGGGGGAAPGTGPATVGVLVTDASSDEYDEAITTINEITLLCDGGQQQLFSGSITVDLLKLRNHLDLLTIADVQPGVCSKIRLRVSRMLLIKRDELGAIEERTEVDLVANGKIDLNPQGDFLLRAGYRFFITLDFDMEKSFKFIETGSGRVKLRPVIFVDISERPLFKNGLTRVHGQIERIADDLRGFILCRTELAAQPIEFDESRDIPKPCIPVALDERTGLFDELGEPIDAIDLKQWDFVTVVGFIRLADAPVLTDNETDLKFVLRAIVVESGARGTWSRIPGELRSLVDPVDDTYLLQERNRDDVSIDRFFDGQLYPKSRIFTFDGQELDRFALRPGDKALVDGVIVPADAVDAHDELRTAFMLVKQNEVEPGPDESVLVGKVKTVDSETGLLVVATGIADRCVAAADATVLFLVDSEGSLEVIKGTLKDLPDNATVVIFGTQDLGGCFIADTIVSQGPVKP